MKRLKKTFFSYMMTFVLVLGCAAGIHLPAAAASAPYASIQSQATSQYGYQTFSVTLGVGYEYTYEAVLDGAIIGSGSLTGGTTYNLDFSCAGQIILRVYTNYDANGDGFAETPFYEQGFSAQAYYLTVTCQGTDGTILQSEQIFMDAYNYPTYSYTAPASFEIDGTVYSIVGGTSRYLQYGDDNQVFEYAPGAMESKAFTVTYVDEADRVLYSDSVSLNYGDAYTLTAPATYEANGVTYQLDSRVSSYDITYDNAASAYVFEYARMIEAPATPYEITVNLVDSDNNNAVLYSIRQTVDVDSVVHIDLPTTYEANLKQYQLADGVDNFIEREFSSTRSTEYNIPYVVAGETVPYDVVINFVDYNHPDVILSAMTATVTPDGEPFIYDIGSVPTLDINGTTYQVVSGQGNGNGQIVHTYGTSSRSYNVYYTAQEIEEPQPYEVTLRYISIEDNSVIGTEVVEVAYGENVEFETAPETMTVGKPILYA